MTLIYRNDSRPAIMGWFGWPLVRMPDFLASTILTVAQSGDVRWHVSGALLKQPKTMPQMREDRYAARSRSS